MRDLDRRATGQPGESARFFDLVERLFSDLGTLLDQKLRLLAVELKNEWTAGARTILALFAGVAVIALGLLLLSLGAALWVGTSIGSVPAGYGIVGFVLLAGGAILLAAMRSRLERQELLPRKTLHELRRDAKWIKDEL